MRKHLAAVPQHFAPQDPEEVIKAWVFTKRFFLKPGEVESQASDWPHCRCVLVPLKEAQTNAQG